MNTAIDYIEANLAGEIDLNKAAETACCSVFHFQRIFFAINGLTPAEYTRKRRLTLAAKELTSGSGKIIDVALKYGYESHSAFTRAFRNLHGVTPQAARKPGVTLTAFPRISFQIRLIGGNDVDYKIVEKPEFDVIAKSETISAEIVHKFVIAPEDWEKFWWGYWADFYREKRDESLEELSSGKPGMITGAGYLAVVTIEDGMKSFSYAVGFEKSDSPVPAGYQVIHIPAATWAIFESTGPLPKAIHDLEDKIFIEWFPSTGYECDDKPQLEVFLPGDRKNKNYRCQVWMPVIKKL